MARVSIAGVGPLVASEEDALVGLTDLCVQMTANGPVLYAVTRGDGYLTGYSLGNAPGQATQQDSWAISSSYLQLESTELVIAPDGADGDLMMVGLKGSVMQGLDLTGNAIGNQFHANADYTAPGTNLGNLTELVLLPDTGTGVGADRAGGLVQVTFGAGGSATVSPISMGAGLDRLYGGAGDDGHFGGFGDDTLWGGSGNDRFFGETGDDIIDGGTGQDTIYAGAGFDTVIGNEGNDLLFGNYNADRFVFADCHGHDTVTDFDALNIYEKIDLSGVSAIVNLSDLLSNHATQVGGNVVIDTGGGNSVTLNGVSLSDLDFSDFVF